MSGSQKNGRTQLVFARDLDTGDSAQDVSITTAPLIFQWFVIVVVVVVRPFMNRFSSNGSSIETIRHRCYHSTDTFMDEEVHDSAGSLLLRFAGDVLRRVSVQ